MARPPRSDSAQAQGRARIATDIEVISQSDFEEAIRDLDGNSETTNLMLFGDSGCGKTVVAGSAPNSLILACEPGYISAARVSLGVPVGSRKIRQIPNSATLLAGLDWLEAGGYKRYEWVVLEGSTTLETKVRLGYAAEAFDKNPESRQHRNLPDKPDYFNTQNFLRSAMARLVDLPVNTLTTAHAMRLDDDAGDRLVLPAFQQRDGALSNYVSGLMHSVGFMRKRSIKDKETGQAKQVRRVLWQQWSDPETGTIYFAKDQFDAFGQYMDNINVPELMALIEKSDQEEEAPPRRASARRRS
jgi:AAA domain